jgi:drug/metabolite transporter (DMT)-like permease
MPPKGYSSRDGEKKRMNATVIASLIGVIASTQIHIAKGLQRYGIEGLRSNTALSAARIRRRRAVYLIGILLNNLGFLWALLANMYAPTAYYTASFGFGLVVMMVFSEFILHEPITKLQHIGAGIIAAGTIFIGIGRGDAPVPAMHGILLDRVAGFTVIYFSVLLLIIAFSLGFKVQKPIGVFFGLFTGGAASFDPIFKGIGQQFGAKVGFLPHTPQGWIFFGGSFLFGLFAFSFTQIGFYRRAKASTLVAFHNIALILVPILFLQIALPGFGLSKLQILGILIVMSGIFLMFTEHTCSELSKIFRRR